MAACIYHLFACGDSGMAAHIFHHCAYEQRWWQGHRATRCAHTLPSPGTKQIPATLCTLPRYPCPPLCALLRHPHTILPALCLLLKYPNIHLPALVPPPQAPQQVPTTLSTLPTFSTLLRYPGRFSPPCARWGQNPSGCMLCTCAVLLGR